MGRLTTRQLASKRGRNKSVKKRVTLQPGDTVQERYRIVGTVGVGGFSSVYQARDMRFQNATKLCAIKEMVIAVADPKVRELTIKSFEREASMLAMLDHPTIPSVTDYFTEGDRSYLVMELIRGKDIEDWLESRTDIVTQEMALDWMLQLSDALIYLHSQNPPIVFRDMKPSNVMLDNHNRIRLIDFNIAKVFEGEAKGTMIGTEGYCPPEQYRGISTPQGDIYALGATFHHLLTRKDPRLEPPFTFTERPITAVNPSVSPELEAVIMRCLDYSPENRYADMETLKQILIDLTNEAVVQEATRAFAATAVSSVQHPSPDAKVSTSPSATSGAAPTAVGEQQMKPLWQFKCEDEIRSKVAVANDMIFVGAYDNNLYALSTEGEFSWKYPTGDGLGSSPVIYQDTVLIGSSDNNLYCLQKANGRVNWRFATQKSIYSSPVVRFDHVFFGSDDSHFYGLNAKQGKLVWKTDVYSPVRSTAYVSDEYVYFGTEGGYIYCLEVSNGNSKWQTQAKRAVTSSPAYKDDIVFAGSVDNTVYAVDALSGWVIWRFRAKRPIISSPAVDDNTVYIGSADGNLYALDLDSGRQEWLFETEGQITSSPALWNDAVYFGSTDHHVYCLDIKRGKLRWKFKTGGAVISSPTIANDIIYIGSSDHHLYALPV